MGKILLVDDDSNILKLYVEELQEAFQDWQIETANCGSDGLTAFYADKPDIVLLDILLPDIDGLKILNLLFPVACYRVLYFLIR